MAWAIYIGCDEVYGLAKYLMAPGVSVRCGSELLATFALRERIRRRDSREALALDRYRLGL